MFHVDKAALVPAQCLFTKSHEGPFIDFGRDFDFDHVGRIYVKASYAREMGVFCGLPSIEERDDLIRQVQERVEEVTHLEADNERLHARVDALEEFKRLALEEKPKKKQPQPNERFDEKSSKPAAKKSPQKKSSKS